MEGTAPLIAPIQRARRVRDGLAPLLRGDKSDETAMGSAPKKDS